MRFTQHPSNNKVLGAPKGWDQKALECGALPVTQTEVDGKPAMVSFWRPSGDEIAQIQKGGLIAIWIISDSHPPVSIGVEP